MTESKFKVGDKVYDICRGIGVVTSVEPEGPKDEYPLEVLIGTFHRYYTVEGKYDTSYINPALLTILEAKAKGYEVPKEIVKRTETQYCLVFENGTLSGQRFKSRGLAEDYARDYNPTTVAIAECVFTWEEEV